MRFLVLLVPLLVILQPTLALPRLASDAALTCFEEVGGANATPARNLTVTLAGERGGVVSGQTIGPLVEGANFSLACCTRRVTITEEQIEWHRNNSSIVGQKKHLVDDVHITTIDVANVTMDDHGLKLTCRDGRVGKRSVILLVIDESEAAGPEGGETANTMVLILFGMILALPFLIILMRAKKGPEVV